MLGILADGERAGHEIITILERQCDRTFAGHEGDLYPLLHRLEERGDIRSRERMNGRPGRAAGTVSPVRGQRRLRGAAANGSITAANAAVWAAGR